MAEEEESLQSKLERHLGPMPRPAARMHIPWFGQVGPFGQSDEEYKARLENWQLGAKSLAPKFAEADLTPMSVRQWSGLTGLSPETGASESQYKTTKALEPSAVPSFQARTMAPTTEPMGTPSRATQMMDEMDRKLKADNPQYQTYGQAPQQLDPLAPQVRSLTPGAPQPSQFVQQPGAPQEISKREINLEAPVNWPQRERYEAMLAHPYGFALGRGMGGVNTYNAKVNDLAQSLLQSGEAKTLEEAHSMASRTINQYDAQQSIIERRGAQTQQGQANLDLKRRSLDMQAGINQHKTALMDTQTKLNEMRMKGDTPELRIKQSMLDIAREKLKFLENYAVMADKAGVYNEDTHNLASQYLAEIAGIMGDIGAQGFFGSLGTKLGVTPAPQVQRVPSGQAPPQAPPVSQTVTPTPSTQSPPSETTQKVPQSILPEDADELRQATEEAMKDPAGFKGRDYVTKSGKKYTFTGEKFE